MAGEDNTDRGALARRALAGTGQPAYTETYEVEMDAAPTTKRSNGLGPEPAPISRVDGGPELPEGAAEWIVGESGRRLRVALFAPAGTARGSVIVSAGRTEPLEKYGEVARELVGRGFVTLVHDWAGQGLSSRFGDDKFSCDVVGGPAAFIGDFRDILAAYAERLPAPWLALAHSMGAALTALALTDGDARFAGAALSAPMVEFSVGKLPFWFIKLVVAGAVRAAGETRLARRGVAPAELAFEGNFLTHDRARYERTRALYRANPELQLGEPTWRWLRFAVELRDQLLAPGAPERIRCPVVAVAAGDDRIVSSPAIRGFMARVPRGRYVEVPESFHEVLMETDDRRAIFWRAFDELCGEVLPGSR
jgi:lysophospholipase